MKEIAADSPQDKPEQSLPHFEKWMNIRTGDINFVLDTVIEKVSEESDELSVYGLIGAKNLQITVVKRAETKMSN